MDDSSLIRQIQRGHREAAEVLVKRYQEFAFHVALKIVDRRHDAEDLATESMVKALLKIDTFRAEASFKSWLYRIVYNDCMTYLRKQPKQRDIVEGDLGEDRGSEEAMEQEEREGQLRRAIDTLPASDQVMLRMFYFEKKALKQVAEALGMTETNTKTRLHRVRQRLKTQLSEVTV